MAVNWNPYNEETKKELVNDTTYLVQCEKHDYMAFLKWCEGWNCMRLRTGEIDRENEFFDVVAWAEKPEPYREE